MPKENIEKLAELGKQYVINELDAKIGLAQLTFTHFRHNMIFDEIGRIPSKIEAEEKIKSLMSYYKGVSELGIDLNDLQQKQINNLQYLLNDILNKRAEEKKKERQCIVTNYSGSYWDGTAGYCSDFNHAKIFNESEIPEFVREEAKVHNDPKASEYAKQYRNKIIYLDTKEGLEILVKEFEKADSNMVNFERRFKDAKKAMEKLSKIENVTRYVELHDKAYHPIIGISEATKERIIEEIVSKR